MEADAESRVLNLSTEWSLSLPVFADIARRWGSFDIDLFASRLNYKVPCYVSWRPDPDAKFIDAFYMDWGPYLFYAFPPFSMIATCLQKITQDKATGVLIVPIWTTQPWFTGILNRLMDKPLILPQSNSLLTQPQGGSSPAATSTTSNGLQSLWQSFQHRGISNDATAIILQTTIGSHPIISRFMKGIYIQTSKAKVSNYLGCTTSTNIPIFS